jgi:hypothetical protein
MVLVDVVVDLFMVGAFLIFFGGALIITGEFFTGFELFLIVFETLVIVTEVMSEVFVVIVDTVGMLFDVLVVVFEVLVTDVDNKFDVCAFVMICSWFLSDCLINFIPNS